MAGTAEPGCNVCACPCPTCWNLTVAGITLNCSCIDGTPGDGKWFSIADGTGVNRTYAMQCLPACHAGFYDPFPLDTNCPVFESPDEISYQASTIVTGAGHTTSSCTGAQSPPSYLSAFRVLLSFNGNANYPNPGDPGTMTVEIKCGYFTGAASGITGLSQLSLFCARAPYYCINNVWVFPSVLPNSNPTTCGTSATACTGGVLAIGSGGTVTLNAVCPASPCGTCSTCGSNATVVTTGFHSDCSIANTTWAMEQQTDEAANPICEWVGQGDFGADANRTAALVCAGSTWTLTIDGSGPFAPHFHYVATAPNVDGCPPASFTFGSGTCCPAPVTPPCVATQAGGSATVTMS